MAVGLTLNTTSCTLDRAGRIRAAMKDGDSGGKTSYEISVNERGKKTAKTARMRT